MVRFSLTVKQDLAKHTLWKVVPLKVNQKNKVLINEELLSFLTELKKQKIQIIQSILPSLYHSCKYTMKKSLIYLTPVQTQVHPNQVSNR
jgi:hypothetical protein